MSWSLVSAIGSAAAVILGAVAIKKLSTIQKELSSMSQNVNRITELSGKIAQDVENIKRNQEKLVSDKAALQQVIDGQKEQIADLQNKIAQGALDEAALSAAAETLDAADKALDAIEPDNLPAPLPDTSGSTGGEGGAGATAETPAAGTLVEDLGSSSTTAPETSAEGTGNNG